MATSTMSAILKRIGAKHRGWVFTPRQFRNLGTRAAVDQALFRLEKSGRIPFGPWNLRVPEDASSDRHSLSYSRSHR
jgi:hypothetical protein